MNKDELISLRKQFTDLKPSIAENQKENKDFAFKAHLQLSDASKLDELLYAMYHYFDKSYYYPLTPEQLQEEILKEIDRSIKEAKWVVVKVEIYR